MPYQKLLAFAAKAATAAASSFRRPEPPPRPTAPWKLDTTRWSAELLKRLEWRRFEELCAAYFEAQGFTTQVSPCGPDGGVDISLTAEGAERPSIILQCKAWNAYGIGIKPLLALHAAMSAGGVPEGAAATSGRFTPEARDFARKHNIQLIDGPELLARIAALPADTALTLLRFATEGDFLTPTCPSCAIKMISRQSAQGGRRFWGCRNYPRCKHIFYATANAPA